MRKHAEKITKILLWAYLCILLWVIVLKLGFSFSELDRYRSLNLIPFYYDRETSFHEREVIQNVLAFVPVGIYLKMLGADIKRAVKIGFAVSFLFELQRFVFACGASDITDIITNTTGALLGAVLYAALDRIVHRPALQTVVNVLAGIATVLLIALLAVLKIANA